MNTEKINQEIINEEVVEDINSEDYQKVLNDEQEAFENGIEDDTVDLDMDEEDINQQTMEFLKSRGKKQG